MGLFYIYMGSDDSVGYQDQDDHQVKQIYSNKCLFPMFHQIVAVNQLKHADQE